MSSEKEMRQQVIRVLKPLHAVSIENGCGSGTPDINYVGGWIECKCLDAWPARPETPVRVPCFTPAQRVWLTKRRQAGGAAFLLLKVGRDWYLFEGELAARYLGHVSRSKLCALAIWFCPDLGEDFLSLIRTHSPTTYAPNLNEDGVARDVLEDKA